MTRLLKNGNVINVFTGEIEKTNVLIRDRRIVGVGPEYEEADIVEDVTGKYICPSFIDGHMHIESTMLLPAELAKVCVPHGTGVIVADPHEIGNVCGTIGISYMLEASEHLPMKFYFMLPSCVPATKLDESGAVLRLRELELMYHHERILGLAEMMNYPGVIYDDPDVHAKLDLARKHNMIVNGHAPLLRGKDLDKYISTGIQDDHECSQKEEALEKLRKGQWIMIRQGTTARNLESLIDLFDPPFHHRCLLVTDDKHPYDLLENGHIDSIIRQAVKLGKSAITGIQMATIQAAQCFGLRNLGAVAPGYYANLLVLDDLDTVDIRDVYYSGSLVCKNKTLIPFEKAELDPIIAKPVFHSFNTPALKAEDFYVEPKDAPCRVICAIPGEVLTGKEIHKLDFSQNNGMDIQRDIVKLAVVERHIHSGHIGLGFIKGLGIQRGAIASSVSHDSHNLIVVGANESDMAIAGNHVVEMSGGLCVVLDGKVLASLPLPVAGLMSTKDAHTVAEENYNVRDAVGNLGVQEGIEPFMSTAFLSLTVIPELKMSTFGLVDVNSMSLVPLFVEENENSSKKQ